VFYEVSSGMLKDQETVGQESLELRKLMKWETRVRR
jgi:hypothetical protein